MTTRLLTDIIEAAIDRYRDHIAGVPSFDGDSDAWGAVEQEEATVEDHVVEALQCLADVAAKDDRNTEGGKS